MSKKRANPKEQDEKVLRALAIMVYDETPISYKKLAEKADVPKTTTYQIIKRFATSF